jgi:hypothetical protein
MNFKLKKKMNKSLREMLIGVILGDAHIGRTGLDSAFITFEQSKKKIEYLNFLHKLTQDEGIVSEEPKTYSRIDERYNKLNESLYFRTKSLEIFKPLADIFLDNDGKKVIPNNISDLLTPRSLAFWIMDDGQQVKRGGVTLCTDSFTSSEINIIREALKNTLNLTTSIHTKKGKNNAIYERIYIHKISLNEVKPLLKKYMHDSMLYKINELPVTSTDIDEIIDFGSDFGDLG